MKDLHKLPAYKIGGLVNAKIITPTNVLKYFEERINKYNPSLNAFVYTKFDEAYEKAKELEEKIEQGRYVGPFAGVPFALKDFLPNKPGWTSSHGGVECLISEDTCYSEFCLAMEAAGGIAIGKTNAPAYGFRGTTDNKLYGPTKNPFDLSKNSGGSSGGSASAVAAGLVPIAEGGDAGGSIRIPASWCNLFGFKPGVGSVPSVIRPDAWSATHPFCFNFALTKYVEDAKILFRIMNRYNSRDPFSLPTTVLSEDINLDNIIIGVTINFNLFEVDKSVAENIYKYVRKLNSGSKIKFIPLNFNFKHTAKEFADTWCNSLIFDSVIELEQDKRNGKDYLNEYKDQFPEELFECIERCKKSNFEDLYKFNLARTDILDNFEDAFKECDFILSPTACCLPSDNANDRNTKGPSQINGKEVDPLIGWAPTYLVNFIGYPAVSIPAGFSDTNLPVGAQIIGKRFSDYKLLKLCRFLEDFNPWQIYYNNIDLNL